MCRRSLWPRMTYLQPTSISIAALISPVKAPFGCVVHVLTAKRDLRALHHFADRHQVHERRADQQIDAAYIPARPTIARASLTAAARSVFIFQLPAIVCVACGNQELSG